MDPGAQRFVAADMCERSLTELDACSGIIPAKVRQIQKHLGTHATGRDLIREWLKQRARATEVTRSGVAQARLDESPPTSPSVVLWSVLCRKLSELCCNQGGPSQSRMLCRLLKRPGHLRVGGLAPEREMSGLLLGVDDNLCQPGVNPTPPLRPDPGDDGRREQRVNEADAIAVELDHPGGDRAVEGVSLRVHFGGSGQSS